VLVVLVKASAGLQSSSLPGSWALVGGRSSPQELFWWVEWPPDDELVTGLVEERAVDGSGAFRAPPETTVGREAGARLERPCFGSGRLTVVTLRRNMGSSRSSSAESSQLRPPSSKTARASDLQHSRIFTSGSSSSVISGTSGRLGFMSSRGVQSGGSDMKVWKIGTGSG